MDEIKITCTAAATLPIETIKDFQGNLKTLSEENLEKLKNAIKKYGFTAPIFIWQSGKSNYILDGHQRLEAVKSLKEEGYEIPELPVAYIKAKDKKEAKEKLLHITSQYGEFDRKGLEVFTAGLIMSDINIRLTNTEMVLQQSVETQGDDEVPEAPEPITKKGDLWELGKHRVLCGDSTAIEDVKTAMGGSLAEMIFTDPPYGVSYASKNKYLNSISKGNRIQAEITNDHESKENIGQIWKNAFTAFIEVMADYSSYYICSPQGGELFYKMMTVIMESGLQLKHQIIWAKNNHVLGRTDYNYKHEPIFYGWHKKHKFYGNGEQKFSVWNYDKPVKSDLHPTMKPVALVENAIQNSTVKGDRVFDGFCGSGSTVIASEKTGRIAHCIEYEPVYADVIVERYKNWCEENGRPYTIKLNGRPYQFDKA